jgi:hypothetical protein
MLDLGCRPHAMSAQDYRQACQTAAAGGTDLPVDPAPCGPTPWDPSLRAAFNVDNGRRVVHEELVLHQLLAPGR